MFKTDAAFMADSAPQKVQPLKIFNQCMDNLFKRRHNNELKFITSTRIIG